MSLLNQNLQAFVAITELKTVHGAAKKIGLSQTGVTQRIRALEKDLATTLFTRSRKGMVPTEAGEELLRYCQAALELEGATYSKIKGAGLDKDTVISLTGPTSLMSSRIMQQCIPLQKKFPHLFFNFAINDLQNRIDDLKLGKVQLAIVPPEYVANEMDSKLLKPEKFVLVASPKWKGRRTKEILAQEHIIDFDLTDTTSFDYLKSFKLLELAQSRRHFVNENHALIQMFQAGIGYGTLNLEIAQPLIQSGKLISLNAGKALEQKHALVWYPRKYMNDCFAALVKSIK